MLTVKHVTGRGAERLFEAQSLSASEFQNGTPNAVGRPLTDDREIYVFTSDGCEVLTHGTIYVMNGDGRTVEQYHLQEKEPPQDVSAIVGTETMRAA